MSVIEVKHVTKDYGHGRGIFDVSFEINEGEAFWILGTEWCWKVDNYSPLNGLF